MTKEWLLRIKSKFKKRYVLYFCVLIIFDLFVIYLCRFIECQTWDLKTIGCLAVIFKDIMLALCPIIALFINYFMQKNDLKVKKELQKLELLEVHKHKILEDFIDTLTNCVIEKSFENLQLVQLLYKMQLYFENIDVEFLVEVRKLLENKDDNENQKAKNILLYVMKNVRKEL